MEMLVCPTCNDPRVVRDGVTKAGRQKYRCRRCHLRWTAGSTWRVDPDTRHAAETLLSAGVLPATIAQALPRCSLRWIRALRSRMARL